MNLPSVKIPFKSDGDEPLSEAAIQELDDEEFEWYDDVDDVPPDFTSAEELPLPDGDDTAITKHDDGYYADRPLEIAPGQLAAAMSQIKKRRIVPFVRELKHTPNKPGWMRGKDVRAVQRALRTRGFKIPRTGVYGKGTAKAVREFQIRRKLKVDGVYGRENAQELAPFFDSYGLYLLEVAKREQVRKNVGGIMGRGRLKIQSAAVFGYNNRYSISYTQSSSRMNGVRYKKVPPQIPNPEDCSSFSKWTYYVAMRRVNRRLPVPDGLNWAPYGFTGTLTAHGRAAQKSRAALGFYGSGRITHVAISVGENSMVISHGSQVGPLLLPFNYRRDFNHWRVYPGVHY